MPYKRTMSSVARICEHCRSTFWVDPYRLLYRSCRTCSPACAFTLKRTELAAALPALMASRTQRTPSCWDWTGAIYPGSGYGHVKTQGRNAGAHVIAWEIASGARVPTGFNVLHTCDRRICVRNDEPGVYIINGVERPRFGHLWLGTHADNMADKKNKGRQVTRERHALHLDPSRAVRGEQHGKTTLTEAQVRAILRRHAEGGITQRQLAREYSVDRTVIGNIVRRKTWVHVPYP